MNVIVQYNNILLPSNFYHKIEGKRKYVKHEIMELVFKFKLYIISYLNFNKSQKYINMLIIHVL